MISDDLTQFARRKRIKREDGSELQYSIPAGVTDEEIAVEIAAMERAVERGYTMRSSPDGPFRGGLRTSMRFINKHPRLARVWLYCAVVPSRSLKNQYTSSQRHFSQK